MLKKITKIAAAAAAKLRDRSRSVRLRVLEIAEAPRANGRPNRERLTQAYQRLLAATGRVVSQTKRFAKDIDDASNGRRKAVLEDCAANWRAWCR